MTKFVDAQEKGRLHPETFEVPDASELAAVAPGWCVKVCAANERFWLKVISVGGNRISGIVDNDLHRAPFALGDVIEVERRHLYDVMPPLSGEGVT